MSVQWLLGENHCHFKELKKVVMWEFFHPTLHQIQFSFQVPTELHRRFLFTSRRCPTCHTLTTCCIHASRTEKQSLAHLPWPKGSDWAGGHGHWQPDGPTPPAVSVHRALLDPYTSAKRGTETASYHRFSPTKRSHRLSPPGRPRSRAGRAPSRARASPGPRSAPAGDGRSRSPFPWGPRGPAAPGPPPATPVPLGAALVWGGTGPGEGPSPCPRPRRWGERRRGPHRTWAGSDRPS